MTLRVEGLTKSFGRDQPALDAVSLHVPTGSRLVLLGPSGCGKTTLLRIIAGLESPDAGAVFIDDRDVTQLKPRARDVAFTFQEPALFPHLDVRGNLSFGLSSTDAKNESIASRLEKAIELLDLVGMESKTPEQLSGGERQRVALGRALIREPSVLLFDEPFSNLDLRLRETIRRQIISWLDETRVPTIIVTHDQDEALALGGKVAVMDAGRVLQHGPATELLERPASVSVASFLGSPPMNLLSAEELKHDFADRVATVGFHANKAGLAQTPGSSDLTIPTRVVGRETRLSGPLLILTTEGGRNILVPESSGRTVASGSDQTIFVSASSLHLFDADGNRLQD